MKNKMLKIAAVIVVAVMCVACLVACVPGKFEKAEENLKAKGYAVVPLNMKGGAFKLSSGLESSIIATNGNEYINIYYYDSIKNANAAYKEHKNNLSANEKKDLKEAGVKMAIMGKYWYEGTEQAIKDAG